MSLGTKTCLTNLIFDPPPYILTLKNKQKNFVISAHSAAFLHRMTVDIIVSAVFTSSNKLWGIKPVGAAVVNLQIYDIHKNILKNRFAKNATRFAIQIWF